MSDLFLTDEVMKHKLATSSKFMVFYQTSYVLAYEDDALNIVLNTFLILNLSIGVSVLFSSYQTCKNLM
jgi:hypothetical protein